MKNKKFSIGTIFFTVFLDLLGLGIIIPILPALLIDPIGGILPMAYSFSTRTLIFGFLIAAYPLAQFFGAPILGSLADQKGRKKILTVSLIGTVVGYAIFILGILTSNLSLLFLGRIVDGFTGGNISIAQSAIADVSTEETKSKNFGLIGMAFGLGFIIGPYVGGKLSDPSVVSWFSYVTPFYLTILLAIINVFLVMRNFSETLVTKRAVKVNLLTGFTNIKKAFTYKDLRVMFLVVFLLTVGFNFFTQFFQVFLFEKFKFTQSQVGDFFAYMGIWIAIAQGAVLRPLSKKFKPAKILSYSIVLLAISFPFLLIANERVWLYLIVPFIAIFQGLTQPNGTAIISNLVGSGRQGEILGINQSISSLAQAVPPIIAGFVTAVNINLPTWFAAISTLFAWLVFKGFFKGEKLIVETKTLKH
ncbi:MFS transporter [Clostridium vincentii]|uniref:Tetracycline resistance protein, class C n=1 Tax=Clostridium vincentii TaxID=52704 RepID=A0A2T0B7E8_9CLOT|nr:MFS transporter [Clostridium vincentii]PRR79819.1 Tetracycline resistance protein, class C [Clostridium vincentii]